MLTRERYVLSPTHLHEFKSADRISFQSPVMSLYLPDQKLGSRSNIDSSSHKFMLKGRQTGGLHRGHGWVFRAESRDTMLAWYEDIKNLTEKTGEERDAFVRSHVRSVSGGSHKASSISSDGVMEEDEADKVPYSGKSSLFDQASPQQAKLLERPQPGGRFPSDLNVNGGLRVPLSPSSGASSDDQDFVVTADVSSPARVRAEQHLKQKQHADHHKNSIDVIDPSSGMSPNVRDSPASNSSTTTAERPSPESNYYSSQNRKAIEHKDKDEELPRKAGSGIELASAETSNRFGISSRLSSRQVPYDEIVLSSVDITQNLDLSGLQERGYLPVLQRQNHNDLPVQEARGEVTKPSSSPANPIQIDPYTPKMQRLTCNDQPVVEGLCQHTHRATASLTQEDISATSGSHLSAANTDHFTQHVESAGINPDGPAFNIQSIEKQSPLYNKPRSPKRNDHYSASTSGMTSHVVARLDPAGSDGRHEPQSDQNGQAPNNLLFHPHGQAISQELLPANLAVSESAEQIPASALVELGEFGSTPKLDDTRTFDSMLSNTTLKSVELGHGNDITLPSRPKVASQPSVGTISDLHVPGEFPRAPGS